MTSIGYLALNSVFAPVWPAVISEFTSTRNASAAVAPPRTPLGELTALPQTSSWIRGGEGDKEGGELGNEGKGKGWEGRERKGKGRRGGERERGLRGGEGKGKGEDPTKFREKLTPLLYTKA